MTDLYLQRGERFGVQVLDNGIEQAREKEKLQDREADKNLWKN